MIDAPPRRFAAVVIGATLLLLACGPSIAPTAGGKAASNAPSGPKTLTMYTRAEPNPLVLFGGRAGTSTSYYERFFMFHGNLTEFDSVGNVRPRLAAKVPTIQDGDWKVNSDGGMEVTWKIRPDVFWHDGKPLIAADFAFGFEVNRDPLLAVASMAEADKISAVKAVDAKTLVVSWNAISVLGNSNAVEGIPSIAKHLMEEPYRTLDPQAFSALPGWTGEYIGLGPYKVSGYEPGTFLTGAAFDQYYLGRPKIDRIVIHWAGDTQVAAASILAGAIDVILPGAAIFPGPMKEIERQWGKGKGRISLFPNDVAILWLNFRVEGHRWDPAQAGWQRDARFRQAMLYSINREPLAADLQESFTPVVYYPAFLEFPVYQQAIQRGIPRYEYDLTKGQQLFAAAGWNKGPDGLLRNSAGQTVEFPCCRYPTELAANTQESLAWGDYFSTAGLVVENPVVQPPIAGLAAAEQRRVQTVNWGGMKSNWAVTAAGAFQTVIKANIATADTRWVGINTAAWSNPAYDDLYAKASKTLELGPRLETQLQMLKIIMDELPVFPVYYTAIGLVARQGVEGLGQPNPFNRSVVDDVHLWDLTS